MNAGLQTVEMDMSIHPGKRLITRRNGPLACTLYYNILNQADLSFDWLRAWKRFDESVGNCSWRNGAGFVDWFIR